MDVAVFVVDGVADFGYAALIETFNVANCLRAGLQTPPTPWEVRTVALGERIRSGNGHILVTTPLAEVGDDFGMMIIPAVSALSADPLVELVVHSQPACSRPPQKSARVAPAADHVADAGRR
ncbi:hypothetical protein AB0M45_21590 [Nocardia sp. NPDC051787]|uniref:hypothetical protein n=1 Tax=Nocardia sp. NPDC051787 TaxID=3155415 RepID=UPI00341D1847